jgi:hypothetical protein
MNELLTQPHALHMGEVALVHLREKFRGNAAPAGQDPEYVRQVASKLAGFCSSQPKVVRGVLRACWDWIAEDRGKNFQELGDTLRGFLEQTIALMAGVSAEVKDISRRYGPVEYADRLEPALGEVRRIRDEFIAHWPWIDERRVAQATAEHGRGEYGLVKEILDALPRASLTRWRPKSPGGGCRIRC